MQPSITKSLKDIIVDLDDQIIQNYQWGRDQNIDELVEKYPLKKQSKQLLYNYANQSKDLSLRYIKMGYRDITAGFFCYFKSMIGAIGIGIIVGTLFQEHMNDPYADIILLSSAAAITEHFFGPIRNYFYNKDIKPKIGNEVDEIINKVSYLREKTQGELEALEKSNK